MRQHQWLREEKRNSRRTCADAIEVLREFSGFSDGDRARFQIGPLQLSSGVLVNLILLIFEPSWAEIAFIAPLPTSKQFKALRAGTHQLEYFDVSRLEGARVDSRATVVLNDGTQLRAVEIIPSPLPLEPTPLDWRILKLTIAIIGAEERCYRSLRDGINDPSLREMLPDEKFVDCSTLYDLDLRPLKMLAWRIADADPTLKRLSQQKLADALCNFGVRIPNPRVRTH